MHKDLTEELSIEDYKMELENRIRNLLWTVSGDYTLDVKPDVSLFLRSNRVPCRLRHLSNPLPLLPTLSHLRLQPFVMDIQHRD